MDDLQTAIRNFYICYDLLNKLCWGGTLPPCRLGFSRRMRKAWANAGTDWQIRFNVPLCACTSDVHILMIMAHEMTHIRQFCQGRPGGHGKDFYDDMERIGITGRINMSTREKSCFAYALFMYSLKNINLAESMKIINRNFVYKLLETSMFNQYKESVLCR